jgi:hypothetical protein
MNLQLLLGCGEPGVLGVPVTHSPPPTPECVPFRQLLLNDLTEALALLPGLEHLSLTGNKNLSRCMRRLEIRGDVLQQLPQLTYLELSGVWLEGAEDDGFGCSDDDSDSAADELYGLGLQHITALTRLADLRLLLPGCSVTSQPACCLTHSTSRACSCRQAGAMASALSQVCWQARPCCSTWSYSAAAWRGVLQG